MELRASWFCFLCCEYFSFLFIVNLCLSQKQFAKYIHVNISFIVWMYVMSVQSTYLSQWWSPISCILVYNLVILPFWGVVGQAREQHAAAQDCLKQDSGDNKYMIIKYAFSNPNRLIQLPKPSNRIHQRVINTVYCSSSKVVMKYYLVW